MVYRGSIPRVSLAPVGVHENMVVVESKAVRGYYRTDERCESCGEQLEAYGDSLTWCTGCM